jgi:hypothetical protein
VEKNDFLELGPPYIPNQNGHSDTCNDHQTLVDASDNKDDQIGGRPRANKLIQDWAIGVRNKSAGIRLSNSGPNYQQNDFDGDQGSKDGTDVLVGDLENNKLALTENASNTVGLRE